MAAWWPNLLPLFLVRWLAKRHGTRLRIGNNDYAELLPDVLIRVWDDSDRIW